jgi:hypothetical protein
MRQVQSLDEIAKSQPTQKTADAVSVRRSDNGCLVKMRFCITSVLVGVALATTV